MSMPSGDEKEKPEPNKIQNKNSKKKEEEKAPAAEEETCAEGHVKVKCHHNVTLHSGHELVKGEFKHLPQHVYDHVIKDTRKLISKA